MVHILGTNKQGGLSSTQRMYVYGSQDSDVRLTLTLSAQTLYPLAFTL